MMSFTDMTEFQRGYQFFMLRPSRAARSFIIVVVFAVIISLIWASIFKIDDVVKATALLRPLETISTVKILASGEALRKNYAHDGSVKEGELLLQLDISADTLELNNSEKLMKRIEDNILLYTALIETIKTGKNKAASKNEEAYLQSEAYLTEYRQWTNRIEGLRIRLEREKSLPDSVVVKQDIEEREQELRQAELQFYAWENAAMIEAINNLKSYTQNRESLERHRADLERNIRNASVYAPISGRINEARPLNVGDYLISGEEIVAIIPDAAGLKAELYVSPAYVAQVKIGDAVTLRFPGLPPSKYGKLEGEISLIPADYSMGFESKPVFIVEAKFKEPWLVSGKGEKIYLRSGIEAIGRIIIGQDTIMGMAAKKLDFIDE
jgi:multidrug efflux pump subunit AcrA (membrane-fusion protein)